MPPLELVILDIVGTTIPDRGEVAQALRAALAPHDLTLSTAELQRWRGASKREIFRAQLERKYGPAAEEINPRLDRAESDFRAALASTFAGENLPLLPGVADTLRWLQVRGVKIALTTGFDHHISATILKSYAWPAGCIAACISSDEVAQGRPAPYLIFRAMEATGTTDVRRVMTVGDTVNDLLAGHQAGVRGVVGVLSGSHGLEQLGARWHTHLIASVAELPKIIVQDFAAPDSSLPSS